MNLFAASRIFEDTTGGTSGIDVEALVADLAPQQILQDQVPTGDEDSSGGAVFVAEQPLGLLQVPPISVHGGGPQEVQDEHRRPAEQEALYDDPDVRQAAIARESRGHGRDPSGTSNDHQNAVRVSEDMGSLGMSLDVQERHDQQSLVASPDELDPDQQDSESADRRQSYPINDDQ